MGMVGPNLTNFGNRRTLAAGTLPNTKAGLREWILDSVHSKAPYQKVKPGSLMVSQRDMKFQMKKLKLYQLTYFTQLRRLTNRRFHLV